MPRVMMIFLESNDLSGKTIIPFCTYGVSSLAGTERKIKDAYSNAEILSRLALSRSIAQNDSATVQKGVDAWLTELGY